MPRIIFAAWVALALVGCGDPEVPRGGLVQLDADPRPDVVDNVDVAEVGGEDTAEGAEVDAVEPDVEIGPGELGAPCESAVDCNDPWCLASAEGSLCSKSCTTTCPRGWACRQNQEALPDVAFVCMPPAPSLCRPCRANADCLVPYDATAHACIPRGDEGAFCGALCADDGDCPDGSFCGAVVDIAGNPTSQCVPESGVCDCSPRATAEGASTACRVGNAFGRCEGSRTCGEGGLSACDAPEPALDVCNGADDNCDGATDEAFVPTPCEVEGAPGVCPGETRCGPDGVVCEGRAAELERCNGVDDDCDGEVDEEDAEGCRDWWQDGDGDTWGTGEARCLCRPEGDLAAERAGDCDDEARRVSPGADERCNGIDDDCDGDTDEEAASGCTELYADGDDDSYGDAGASRCLCAPADGFDARDPSDCDDARADINPAAGEGCNGVDDDCDGATDEAGAAGCALWFRDGDGDGFGDPLAFRCLCEPTDEFGNSAGGDCDDGRAGSSPGEPERCNGFDDDCDGLVDEAGAGGCETYLRDEDGDGFGLDGDAACLCAPVAPYVGEVGGDCDDREAAANPEAAEVCDGRDNDCDGAIDPAGVEGCVTFQQDRDGDGRGVAASACLCAATYPFSASTRDDCDDTNPFISPAAAEVCNGLDDDCDEVADEDVTGLCTDFYRDGDGDGWGADGEARCLCGPEGDFVAPRAGDCDDVEAAVRPFAEELCNQVDDDCDGQADEDGALGCVVYFADRDGDGVGVASDGRCLCAAQAPYAALAVGDCDDDAGGVRPGAAEVCNGRDDDCDGVTDEANASGCRVLLRDTDGDGFGLALDEACLCAADDTYRATTGGDCDDALTAVNPAADEVCNGLDDDCDGVADDPDAPGCEVRWVDVDGDGWGGAESACLCAPIGTMTATRGGDCEDLVAAANPAGTERCNQRDDDCDGATDEADAAGCTSLLADTDGDGFGVDGAARCLCAPDATHRAVVGGDCDDVDADRSPGLPEVCNGKDDDCDQRADPDGSRGCSLRFRDGDGDGYGLSEDTRCACTVADPYDAELGGDCDDRSAAVAPGEAELCNGVDDDCDGLVDEAGAKGCETWYLDADGDGHGLAGQGLCLCGPQAAYSTKTVGDCDDGDARRTPGKAERCNGVDDDCDLTVDEADAIGCAVYWTDVDDDTFGADGASACVCAPSGDRTATRAGDCDDTRSAVNAAATEVCDAIDNDCDRAVDEVACGLPTVGWPTFMRDARRTGHPFSIEGPTAADTALRWKKQLAAGTPFESSPVIDEEGFVYVALGATLFKLEPATGNTVWKLDLPAAPFSRASPTVRVGGTLLVAAGNGLVLVSKAGAELWRVDFGGAPTDRVVGSPIVDQSGAIYVVSNTHLRALDPLGAIAWETAIAGSPTKASDPAIGPDGRIYLSGAARVYSLSKAGAINWSWCPLTGNQCDPTRAPGTSVTVSEVGRVLAPMGHVLYLLADAQTAATVVDSETFTTGSNAAPARLWSNVPVFSTGYTCCNPEEYPLVTPASNMGLRQLQANLGVDFTEAVNKRDQPNGAAIFDRDGDIFVGSNATTANGRARFGARRSRGQAAEGDEYWGADVDGAHIDGAPALGNLGNVRYVVFGDSSGTIYSYGK